jgi:hypothetical protein
MANHGVIESDFEILPGNGVRWVEYNPHTGVRATHSLRDGVLVVDTEYLGTDALIDANAEQRNDLAGSRWGSGKVFARVPMNLYGEGYLADAVRARDAKAQAKWFNDIDNRAFRTFEGNI